MEITHRSHVLICPLNPKFNSFEEFSLVFSFWVELAVPVCSAASSWAPFWFQWQTHEGSPPQKRLCTQSWSFSKETWNVFGGGGDWSQDIPMAVHGDGKKSWIRVWGFLRAIRVIREIQVMVSRAKQQNFRFCLSPTKSWMSDPRENAKRF